MFRFLKKFFSEETPKRKDAMRSSAPREEHRSAEEEQPLTEEPDFDPQAFFESLYSDIDFVLSRLTYVGKDPADQWEKRQEAMKRLPAFGVEAKRAIPTLVRLCFSDLLEEKSMAAETLEDVAPDWPRSREARELIPFLIKKLNRNRPVVAKASRMLVQIGSPAVPPLLEIVREPPHADEFLQANALLCLSQMKPSVEELPGLIREILSKAEAGVLIQATTDAIGHRGRLDAETVPFLFPLLSSEHYTTRAAALRALSFADELDDSTLPLFFTALSDIHAEVRQPAIKILQQINSPVADDFYYDTLTRDGRMGEEELKRLFDKMHFVFSKSVVESFRASGRKVFDNLSWYNLEFQRAVEEPQILLESVLTTLAGKSTVPDRFVEPVKQVFERTDIESIQKACVTVLGKFPQEAFEVLPFLIPQLNHPSEAIRKEVVETLPVLRKDWIQTREAADFINELISGFDTSNRIASQKAILSIGDPAIPLLTTYLDQTEQRVIQQTILEVLGKLGSTADLTLATLLRLKERCRNTHTITAINELIEGFDQEE